MGAPAILIEKPPGGQEANQALDALRRVLASGVCDDVEGGKAGCGGVEVVEKPYTWIDGSQINTWLANQESLNNVDLQNVPKVSTSI